MEEGDTRNEHTGVKVATILLKVSFPPSRAGEHVRVRKVVMSALKRGNGKFEDKFEKEGPVSRLILSDALEHGTLSTRFLLEMQEGQPFAAKITYWIDSNHEEMYEEVSRRFHGMLEELNDAARKESENERKWLPSVRCQFFEEAGGAVFRHLLADKGRDRALILVSDAKSYPEGFFDWMESDLGEKTILTEMNRGATSKARKLFKRDGKRWPCPRGSVSIFFPGWGFASSPDLHRFWQQDEIVPDWRGDTSIFDWHNVGFEKTKFRSVFLRELFLKSQERMIAELAEAHGRTENQESKAAELEDELERIKYELGVERDKNADLKEKAKKLEKEILELRARLNEKRAKFTVQDAVELAIKIFGGKCRDTLVFGEDVRKEAGKLNEDAGPPEKVLCHLTMLHDFVMAKRMGSVVEDLVVWLEKQGCDVSRETLDSMPPEIRKKRQRRVNGKTEEFHLHTKPNNDAGAKGVRIYFKWDSGSKKILVGYIGPHLPTTFYK